MAVFHCQLFFSDREKLKKDKSADLTTTDDASQSSKTSSKHIMSDGHSLKEANISMHPFKGNIADLTLDNFEKMHSEVITFNTGIREGQLPSSDNFDKINMFKTVADAKIEQAVDCVKVLRVAENLQQISGNHAKKAVKEANAYVPKLEEMEKVHTERVNEDRCRKS